MLFERGDCVLLGDGRNRRDLHRNDERGKREGTESLPLALGRTATFFDLLCIGLHAPPFHDNELSHLLKPFFSYPQAATGTRQNPGPQHGFSPATFEDKTVSRQLFPDRESAITPLSSLLSKRGRFSLFTLSFWYRLVPEKIGRLPYIPGSTDRNTPLKSRLTGMGTGMEETSIGWRTGAINRINPQTTLRIQTSLKNKKSPNEPISDSELHFVHQ